MSDVDSTTPQPATLEEAIKEIDNLRSQLSGSDLKVFTQNRELRVENQKLKEEIQQLTEQCVSQTFTVRGLEKSEQSLKTEVAEYTSKVADLEAQVQELGGQLEEHRSKEIHLSQELEKAVSDGTEALENLRAKYEGEVQAKEAQYEQARIELEETLSAKEQAIQQLENRVEQFKEEFLSQEFSPVTAPPASSGPEAGQAYELLTRKMEDFLGYPGKAMVEQVFRLSGVDTSTSNPSELEETFEVLQDTAGQLVRSPEQEKELAEILKSAWQEIGMDGVTPTAAPLSPPEPAAEVETPAAPEVSEEESPSHEPSAEPVATEEPAPSAEESAEAAQEPEESTEAPEPEVEVSEPETAISEHSEEVDAEADTAPEPESEPEVTEESSEPEVTEESPEPEITSSEEAPESADSSAETQVQPETEAAPATPETATEPESESSEEVVPTEEAVETTSSPAEEEVPDLDPIPGSGEEAPSSEEESPSTEAEPASEEKAVEESVDDAPETEPQGEAPSEAPPSAEAEVESEDTPEPEAEPTVEPTQVAPAQEEQTQEEVAEEPAEETAPAEAAEKESATPETAEEAEEIPADFEKAAAFLEEGQHGDALPVFEALSKQDPLEPTYQVGQLACLAGLARFADAYRVGKALEGSELGESIDVYNESMDTALMGLASESESDLVRKEYILELLRRSASTEHLQAYLDEADEIALRVTGEGELSLIQASHRIGQEDVTEYLIDALHSLSNRAVVFALLKQNLERYPELTPLSQFLERLLDSSRAESLEAEKAVKELLGEDESIEDLLDEVDPGEEAMLQVFTEHLIPRSKVSFDIPSEDFEELLLESEPAAFVGALRQALRSVDYTVFFDEIEVLSYDGDEHFLLRSSPEPSPTLLFKDELDDVPPEELRFLVLRELFSMYRKHSHLAHISAGLDDEARIKLVEACLEIFSEMGAEVPQSVMDRLEELKATAQEEGQDPDFKASIEAFLKEIYRQTESDSFLELGDFLYDKQLNRKWLDSIADSFAAKQTGIVVASYAIARDALPEDQFEELEENGFGWLYSEDNLPEYAELRLRLQRLWASPLKALISEPEE